jgi:mono/diheme cytochrome c family protein
MDRTFSKRRYLITTLIAAGLAASVPACTGTELPPEIDHPIKVSAKPPAAISGGTLMITKKDIAVAADADRDLVWLVDLNNGNAVSQVALNEGDEPGRVVEDAAGRIHVALRRGGAVATIDMVSGKVIDRTAVCPAPRGLAFDGNANAIHVACAGGELVTLPAGGGKATRVLRLKNSDKSPIKDLRDVIVSGNQLVVSRFRAAKLLVVDADGIVVNEQAPPGIATNIDTEQSFQSSFAPTVAYRVVPMSTGFAMVHQRSLTNEVVIEQPGGYGSSGGGCDGGIVHPAVTLFDAAGNPGKLATPAFSGGALPVDLAVDPGSSAMAMVAAGSNLVIRTNQGALLGGSNDNVVCAGQEQFDVDGEPVAVAFWQGHLLVQTRQPATIQFVGEGGDPTILPGVDMGDTGHDLFHQSASPKNGLSCASCHPEGREDGHVWKFSSIGARRTQTVGGHVLDTAPFHWDGDMPDINAIMSEVFVHRMGGVEQGPRHSKVLQNWVGSLPAFPASEPEAPQTSIDHGKVLFNDAKVACSSCHGGEHFTNNTNANVGTSRSFQVPTLVGVSARAPFMHNGCANTLRDRFAASNDACTGGNQHGDTSGLSESDVDDLVNYLETL